MVLGAGDKAGKVGDIVVRNGIPYKGIRIEKSVRFGLPQRLSNLFGGSLSPVFSPNPPSPRGFRPDPAGGLPGAAGPGASRAQRINAALANAGLTPGSGDDLKALTSQRLLLEDQIAVETKRLGRAVNQKQYNKFYDNLLALKNQESGVLGQIQSIQDQTAADAQAKADKIRAAAAAQARAEAAIIAASTRSAQQRVAAMSKLGDLLVKNVKAMLAKRRAAAAAIASVSRGTFENPINLPGKVGGSGNIGGKAAGGGYTLEQLFEEASSEFALYGSNVGGPGTPLSPQDARGAFAGTVKTHQTTVVQNFYGQRDTGQAMRDAQSVARNAK